ncbi:hypothetical protein LEP1GSC074_3980 [Leptospira noguchii str. Hook]|uniref:hypothetical protein n=1 Tax=Leptospira noguchii TaxID=28182 RepID=UPI00032874C6|nr:hypothetical protein [Leptospira noguchii]EMS89699.1 hypothetical protein LEP1GSC074_3980 [Leptospira noguchii str. Hook]
MPQSSKEYKKLSTSSGLFFFLPGCFCRLLNSFLPHKTIFRKGILFNWLLELNVLRFLRQIQNTICY